MLSSLRGLCQDEALEMIRDCLLYKTSCVLVFLPHSSVFVGKHIPLVPHYEVGDDTSVFSASCGRHAVASARAGQ